MYYLAIYVSASHRNIDNDTAFLSELFVNAANVLWRILKLCIAVILPAAGLLFKFWCCCSECLFFMAVVMIAVSFVPSVSVLDSKYECAALFNTTYCLVNLGIWLNGVTRFAEKKGYCYYHLCELTCYALFGPYLLFVRATCCLIIYLFSMK